jgi:hypothetical protein
MKPVESKRLGSQIADEKQNNLDIYVYRIAIYLYNLIFLVFEWILVIYLS